MKVCSFLIAGMFKKLQILLFLQCFFIIYNPPRTVTFKFGCCISCLRGLFFFFSPFFYRRTEQSYSVHVKGKQMLYSWVRDRVSKVQPESWRWWQTRRLM